MIWHAHRDTKEGPAHHHEGIMHVSIHKIQHMHSQSPKKTRHCNPSNIRLCVEWTNVQLSGFSQ